jgi:DNA-binding Xre family transcriptional regulator
MGGIERGEHNIALINIQKIADALDLSVSDLLKTAGI